MADFSLVLNPPRAYGAPLGNAVVRAQPEDFIVREWLGYEPDGEGDHLLLRVRKRGANTMWVAKQLARIGKLHPKDVGFAGLKDRDAVAEQWFSVPRRSSIGDGWKGLGGDGFEVIDCVAHRRKLKRGALRGNEFVLRLREFQGESTQLESRLTLIQRHGVPNYFGPQRFGREGHNLSVAEAWFANGVEPADRFERGFAISAARSAIFNAVLAQRVVAGTWNRLLPGELANLDGSNSHFAVTEVDDVLARRCEQLDIHPTGPLWAGSSTSAGAIADIEGQVARCFEEFARGLETVGLEAERRALRMRVADLTWSIAESEVTLQFRLGRGCFATAVLHELIGNAFSDSASEGGE